MKKLCRQILDDETAVVLDTETTGLDGAAEILELAILGVDGEMLFDELIRPSGAKEWPGAERVHGISPEMVKDAPTIDRYLERLMDLLMGRRIVVFNAPYDSRLLSQSLRDVGCHDWDVYGLKWVDVMVPYARYWGQWNSWRKSYKWQSLTHACAQQKVEVAGAHRALGDCRMTLALLRKIAEG